MNKLLASSATLKGIHKLASEYFQSNLISLIQINYDPAIWKLSMPTRSPANLQVIKKKNRYRLERINRKETN